jgi:hypothetical protein
MKDQAKLSEIWWNRCKNYYTNHREQTVFYIEESELEVLNQLITFEVRIEELTDLTKEFKDSAWKEWMIVRKKRLECEYQYLGIKHGLIDPQQKL